MKVLSIKQPWASLIIQPHLGLLKDIENRSWHTNFRGNLLVHASLQFDQQGADWIQQRFGIKIAPPGSVKTGGIIGMVYLSDCVTRHRSLWFVGPFGFVLRDPYPLPFEPCQGKLGLWDYDLHPTSK